MGNCPYIHVSFLATSTNYDTPTEASISLSHLHPCFPYPPDSSSPPPSTDHTQPRLHTVHKKIRTKQTSSFPTWERKRCLSLRHPCRPVDGLSPRRHHPGGCKGSARRPALPRSISCRTDYPRMSCTASEFRKQKQESRTGIGVRNVSDDEGVYAGDKAEFCTSHLEKPTTLSSA